MDTHPHWLAVYGTLKRGHGNNPLLVGHNSIFVAPAVTVEKYILNDSFPYVFPVPEDDTKAAAFAGKVRVDLYRVTDVGLRACDGLEGHPTHYCRTPVEVEYVLPTGDKTVVTAGIYLMEWRNGRFIDPQEPDSEGFLEWGRDRPRLARNFQRETSAKRRRELGGK